MSKVVGLCGFRAWFYRDNGTALLYSVFYNFFASNSLKNHLDPENIYFLSISILFAALLIHSKVYELENQIVSVVDQFITEPTHTFASQGNTAFSYTDKVVFGTTSSASIPIMFPYPSHTGQAP
jgi:hypothetical protein